MVARNRRLLLGDGPDAPVPVDAKLPEVRSGSDDVRGSAERSANGGEDRRAPAVGPVGHGRDRESGDNEVKGKHA